MPQLWSATRKGEGRRFPLSFLKITLILEKIALFVCIYGLNSHLKCSFKNILKKKQEKFSLRSPAFVCRAWSVYQSASVPRNLPCSKKSLVVLLQFSTFHTNFHPNIWVFANLPIYKKSIHDTFALETLVRVILNRRYVLFLVINVGIIISASVILKTIKFIVLPIYLHCCNIPEGYSSSSSKISYYVNIVEITATQHYTRIV